MKKVGNRICILIPLPALADTENILYKEDNSNNRSLSIFKSTKESAMEDSTIDKNLVVQEM